MPERSDVNGSPLHGRRDRVSSRIVWPALGVLMLTVWVSARAAATTATVIAVEAARGSITAVERASGNLFTFTVKQKELLAAFKPCTSFDADIGAVKPGATFAADFGPLAEGKTKAGAPCCTLTAPAGSAGRVLGVQPHAKFEGVEIMLMEIKRTEGDLATATYLYCNGGSARVDLASELRARVRNAKLLDLGNRVEHQIVRTGGRGGDPMMSNHGPGLKLDPHQTAKAWVTFSAPAGPTVTLHLPGAAAPFENVTVTK